MRSLILFFSFSPIYASTIYSIADLGTLGGSSSVAFGINSAGTAVGWMENASGNMSAFSSLAGSLSGLPGSSDSYAYGMNASGNIVGISYVNGQARGVIWNGASAADLGEGIFATGINDSGAVIGSNGHAFLLVNGVYQDLGVLPGGDWSAAYSINNSGEVVGYGDIAPGVFRAFTWTPSGGLTQLGTFGGRNSYAAGINAGGEVVGNASLPDGYNHAFLAIGALMTDLGTLGGASSFAYAINNDGTIVGYSWLSDGETHAFVYFNGIMLDLNSLIPSGSGWDLLEAYGINNAGQIVGEGLLNRQSHAFLLDPGPQFARVASLSQTAAPDPGTASLTGVGIALLLPAYLGYRARLFMIFRKRARLT